MDDNALCFVNLGPKGVRSRRIAGAAAIFIAAVAVVVVAGLGVHWMVSALAFLPFFFGALGVMQAKEKT